MCCFSTPTHVSDTKIFARMLRPGVQGLAYQMAYEADKATAMILPLPVALPAREDSVRFKNLKAYPRLFADLDSGFPAAVVSRAARATSAAGPERSATLVVHDVGDFVASFVPSQADFGRIDPRFVLSKDVWAKLPQYSNYGFAVFQLKELRGSPHPIAFEFDTRTPDSIFFPTVHIHDGTVHDKDEFDHVLYTQDAVFDQRAGSDDGGTVDSDTGFVRSKGKAQTFTAPALSQGLLAADLLVLRRTLKGTHPNRDTTFDIKSVAAPSRIDDGKAPAAQPQSSDGKVPATAPGGCGRCDAGPGASLGEGLPMGAAMAGIAWIIRRRDARRKGQ